jgi:hypothetical protein
MEAKAGYSAVKPQKRKKNIKNKVTHLPFS